MNQRFARILAAFVLIVLSASAAVAQHDHPGASAPTAAPTAQTGDAMQQCQKHHSEGVAALDQAASSLAQAKQLSDPNEIKAAIGSAEKQISEAKHHLSMCPMSGSKDPSGMHGAEHQGHKMKCMSSDSQPEQ